MPNLFPCTRCGALCTAKQLWTPKGCAHCICGNCGKPLGDGHDHFEITKDPDVKPVERMIYICPPAPRVPY